MATYTENYNMILPEAEDAYDVEDYNENFRAIDGAFSSLEDTLEEISSAVSAMESRIDALAEKPSSVIKSIQSFTLSKTITDANAVTHPIDPVDPTRCIVLMDYFYDKSSGQADISYTLTENSLVLGTNGTVNGPVTLRFQIVEFH